MSNCTIYIDEAGDLGVCRGTQWFVLSAVIVDKTNESQIRNNFAQIKTKLNVRDIHLRKITDFYKRAFIVKEIAKENFTYVNIIADTNKFDVSKIPSSTVAYNYICRMLLERVSWFLRDTNRIADVVLSARGTSRDNELIDYIKDKLIPYSQNEISKKCIRENKCKIIRFLGYVTTCRRMCNHDVSCTRKKRMGILYTMLFRKAKKSSLHT